ncbi:MAG: glycosyltransferase family 39 protein, partial [Gemmatimonadales bacterium]
PKSITSQTELLNTSQRVLVNEAAHWALGPYRRSRLGGELGLALVAVLIHLLVNLVTPYEIHRDEFLYAAMGRHLSLFGMDFPPLIAILSQLERLLFGSTLFALRLIPALCHGALVLVTGQIARQLGGNQRAAALAAFTVLLSPLTLRSGSLFQPVVLDQLIWTVGYLLLALIAVDDRPKWWRWLGVVGGIDLLAKFSIGFFAVGAVAALLLSAHRQAFRTREPWLAALIALVIGSPSIIGQIVLGWPVRGQMSDLAASQLQRVTALGFISEQFLYGPMMWLGLVGMVALFQAPQLRPWRLVAVAALTTALLLLVLHGKAYYLGPIWPALAAAGAVWVEPLAHRPRRWLVSAIAAVTAIFGVSLALPIGLPILPKIAMAEYASRTGITSTVRTNLGEVAPLPQDFADMLGWQTFAENVIDVWDSLPASERATAVLVATNYGRAGALDWYGPRFGLPPAICPCGSYWFWGHGDRAGAVTVIAGGDSTQLAPLFQELHAARVIEDAWRVKEEQRVTIWIGRGPKLTLAKLWDLTKGKN